MRVGKNPLKDQVAVRKRHFHRVILPAFIPQDKGYFEHAADVLEVCLRSLLETTGEETAVTIVVNGASPKARAVIGRFAGAESRVDVIWKACNVGKVEALFGAARMYHEPMITMTDSDVLFRPGWLERVFEVFEAFPEAGVVSALPVPHLRRHYTSSTYLGSILRGLFRYGPNACREDMEMYLTDLQSPALIPNDLLEAQPAVIRDGVVALIGSTHMECTMRREVVEAAPRRECLTAMGGNSEWAWMDRPADVKGWWKLSLPVAYVRHMGNSLSEDIISELHEICANAKIRDQPELAAPDGRLPVEHILPGFIRDLGGRAVQWWFERRRKRQREERAATGVAEEP